MSILKTDEEIEIIREGGKITAEVLKEVLNTVKIGVRLKDLDDKAEKLILKYNAQPSFKTVEGYKFATCTNINDGVVHGIPSDREIKEGDIVSVDLGTYYKGFHTDSAWSTVAGNKSKFPDLGSFLNIGEQALRKALEECVVGNNLSDISRVIQDTVEGAGYSVVRDLVGHGVGRTLHEPPEVPGYVRKGYDLRLKRGLVLAIEVIYNKGLWPVVVSRDDGWTIRSRDGSISGLFEHTVAITDSGPIVVTESSEG